MVLNSYFLQGSTGEQSLMQNLVNEHIQIHGIEVYYLPRKIFKTDNIIKEIQSSKFDINCDSMAYNQYVSSLEQRNLQKREISEMRSFRTINTSSTNSSYSSCHRCS